MRVPRRIPAPSPLPDVTCDTHRTAGLVEFIKINAELSAARKVGDAAFAAWRYFSAYALVLAHGTHASTLRPLPRSLRGEPRECFNNAFALATFMAGQGIPCGYCEGWAMAPQTNFPVHHGWVALPDGVVIDPTWHAGQLAPDAPAYFGVVLDLAYVDASQTKYNTAPVLDVWMHRWPILRDDPKQYLGTIPPRKVTA